MFRHIFARRVFARTLPVLAFAFALGSPARAAEAGLGLAQVRQIPAVNGGGTVEGSIHMMSGGAITLNGGATITGDLLVPGTPVVRTNGKPNYGGTLDGAGPAAPSGYTITLNGQPPRGSGTFTNVRILIGILFGLTVCRLLVEQTGLQRRKDTRRVESIRRLASGMTSCCITCSMILAEQ